MSINKIENNLNNAQHLSPGVKNSMAPQSSSHEDFKTRAIREDRQLQNMLGRETILEIRKINDYHYMIMTNGGHEIPIEIHSVPYGRPARFINLDWNGGLFAIYTGM